MSNYDTIIVTRNTYGNRIVYTYQLRPGGNEHVAVSLPLLADNEHVQFVGDGFWFGTIYLVPVGYDVDTRALLCHAEIVGKKPVKYSVGTTGIT